MELFDEDLKTNQKTDNKRTTTIILVLIIFLIILMLGIVGFMVYLKQTAFVLKLNGQDSSAMKNIINIDSNNPNDVYIPIKKAAKILGYQPYDGSYTTKSEEPNECYVESKDEVAMFSLSSKKIYKTLTTGDMDFECFEIQEPVKAINGELYTTIEGIQTAFNVKWEYDIENNKMDIKTMPYLIQQYSQFVVNNGYTSINENFTNQKAILDDMIIVNKSTDSNGDKVAVLDISGSQVKTILEPKYDNIEYLQHTKDFLVTANSKKGIIGRDRSTIVRSQYDDIILMDYNKKLYAVKISDKYGIIDFKGNNVLDADYSIIGIDISNFKENDIKSKYIIADRLIPIKGQNGLWGFFDTVTGKPTELKYEQIGYITTNNRAGSGYSLLAVPNYNVIVVGKNRKYSVITSSGEEIEGLPFVFDSIYLSIYGGQSSYVLDYNSETYDLLEQLDGLGYGRNRNSNSKKSNTIQEENQENTNNQQEENNNEQQNNNVEQQNNQNQQDEQQNNQNQQNEQQNNENNNNQNGNNNNENQNNNEGQQQENNTEENRE